MSLDAERFDTERFDEQALGIQITTGSLFVVGTACCFVR